MGLETFSGIWSLSESNPLASDDLTQGDDHLRGIKGALQRTFPNISSTVSLRASELSSLSGVAGNIQNQIDSISTNIDSISANLASVSSSLETLIAVTQTYGGLYINNSSAQLSSTSSATLIIGWTDITPAKNVTISTAGGSLTMLVNGVYKVDASMSFSGGVSAEYTVLLYKDDVNTGFGFTRKLGTGGDVGAASLHGILSCSVSSVLALRVLSVTSSSYTLKYAQFLVDSV